MLTVFLLRDDSIFIKLLMQKSFLWCCTHVQVKKWDFCSVGAFWCHE